MSCAGDTPCPGGLSCGADLLCHGGATECSALDAGPGDDAPLIDARGDAPPPLAYCDRTQPGLVACYELEDTAIDPVHRLDIERIAGPAFVFKPGKVGQALSLDGTTLALIGETARLDLAALTIEAWLEPSGTTGGNNVSVVNNLSQYGLTIDTTNTPVCAYYATAAPAVPIVRRGASVLATGVWTHLACTYDGARLALYVDGVAIDPPNATGGTIVTDRTTGTGIGSTPGDAAVNHYVGLIDQLRIFNLARTAGQICLDAGNPSCPPP